MGTATSFDMSEPYSPTKDENARTCSRRDLGAVEPTALLRHGPGVPANRHASGPGASVRGTPGGGGHRGLPM